MSAPEPELDEVPVGDVKPADAPPYFDPAVHTGDDLVYVQMFCACGSLWRQRDPAGVVAPFVAAFTAAHTGPGHGEVSKAECIAEREARREAAFRVQGAAHEYAPREHPYLNTECTRPRPWPVLPELTREG